MSLADDDGDISRGYSTNRRGQPGADVVRWYASVRTVLVALRTSGWADLCLAKFLTFRPAFWYPAAALTVRQHVPSATGERVYALEQQG